MSRNLKDLHPEFLPTVGHFLDDIKTLGIDLIVTCTLRSNFEQAVLYAQGRTAPGKIVTRAQPGQSAHNWGLAIDVVPVVNGKPCWEDNNPVWQEIGSIGLARGMEWYGVPGAAFHELPHFQMPNWKSLAK